MADKMVFPIGFDLKKGVDDVIAEWDSKWADKLEKGIQKRAINVKLALNDKKFDYTKLEDVKKRLESIKLEPIDQNTRQAIRDLARELQTLAKALEQVQKYSKAPTRGAVDAAKVNLYEEKAKAQAALAAQRTARAEYNLAAARDKAARAAERSVTATRKANQEYQNQDGYISRLLKRMAVYASFSQVGNFLTKVREVTAQFELQKVSLGAIIQDQAKANALFAEIKSFALKSPVSIMDMTKYTKQLAAYKFETKDLFEWTKKLTDVSVGLGVSMDRVVLAVGQTRATGYLRASEIRQFTEMGVPIVEELASKLTKMNGELVTAAQVMDMVSKRAISFSLVEEVFNDMTSAGGMFYNMQEKQGNTLFGLWAKLGDAASVMYDQIGNTDSVNSAMKTTIGLLTELMRNWKAVGKTLAYVVAPSAAMGMLTKYSLSTTRKETADKAAAATAKARKDAVIQLSAAIEKDSVDDINAANAALEKAKADDIAAQKAASKLGLLKSGFTSVAKSIASGLGIGLAITAVTTFAYKLFEAYENAHRLDRKLNEIDAERITLSAQSVRNFEYLADIVVKSVDGSKKQNEALAELHRTYKDMIPTTDITVENLRHLREGTNSASEAYKSLTNSIREYIAEQQKQKKLSAIKEEYGSTITDRYKKLQNALVNGEKVNIGTRRMASWVELRFSSEEFERAMMEFEKRATDKTESVAQKLRESFAAIGIELTNDQIKAMKKLGKYGVFDDSYFESLNTALENQAERVDAVHKAYNDYTGDLGKYKAKMDEVAKGMENVVYKNAKGEILDSNSFQRSQMQLNKKIRDIAEKIRNDKDIQNAFKQMGVEVQDSWFDIVDKLKESDLGHISSIQFDEIINAIGNKNPQLKALLTTWQKEYNNLVPSDRTVQVLRAKLINISQSTGVSMDKLKNHWMNAGENIEDYAKRIKDAIEDLQKKIMEMNQVNADKEAMKPGSFLLQGYSEEEIKQANAMLLALQQLFSGLSGFTKGSNGNSKSDSRLNNLKEEISLTKKLYDEYNKLEKQIGKTKAAEKIQSIYANTIKTLQERAGKYGFEFELPFTDDNLKANLQHFIDKMKELQKLTNKKGKPLFPNIGKDIDEAVAQLEDIDLNSLQKALDKKLKDLADRISRTKTAKEFYEKILSQTGDVELAANVSLAIYGDTGKELFKNTIEQIREVFKSGNADVDLKIGSEIDSVIDLKNERINYGELAKIYKKYQDQIIEKNRDTASKIVSEGQKTAASNIDTWSKELAKAKSIEEQRTDIIKTETERRNAIIKSDQKQNVKDELIALSYEKQAQELAKLSIKEFKDSDDYIKVFQDLDRVSSQTLDRMKRRLEEMIKLARETENVEGLKSLVEQLDKINDERETRNPVEGVVKSFKEYFKARKDYQTAQANEATAKAEFARREAQINQEIADAKAEQEAAQARVNDLQKQGLLETNEGVTAQLALNDATTKVANAEKKRANAVKKVNKAEQDVTDALDAQKAALAKLQKNVNAMANAFNSAASSIKTIADMMGVAEDSELGDIVNGLVSGLQNAATIMTTILAIAIAIESACWWLLAIGAAVSAFTAIGSWLTGSKVRKANKEIERQQKLLDQLEYTYGRLEKAAEKAFGGDYINNFKQQQKNLQAQQLAYEKQLEAEKSKGKKADDDKIKEYENAYRDTMDKIADMQNQVANQMLGTDLASAARDFAQAWLDAYKEFGKTSDAISEKFKDMIQNMVVEGALAKVMENALQPAFNLIDKASAENLKDESWWRNTVAEMEKGADAADKGASIMMKWLEKSGINLRSLGGELTGISRDIAGASEESINGLAAAENTRNFYIAQMLVEVQGIRGLLQGGTPSTDNAEVVQWKDWQGEAMNRFAQIEANTALTAQRAETAANAALDIAAKLGRVIDNSGGQAKLRVRV